MNQATRKVATGQRLEDIEMRLADRLRRQIRNLVVLSSDKGIILRGIARSYYAKQLAQEAVLECTPLPLYLNEIEVQPAGL